MSDNQKKLLTLQIAINGVAVVYQPLVINLLKEQFPEIWKEKLRQLLVYHKFDIDTDMNTHDMKLHTSPESFLKDPSVVFNVIIRLYQDTLKSYSHPDFELRKLSYFHEMRNARNQWAHGQTISSMDLLRYLDTATRLLSGIVSGRKEYEIIEKLKQDLIIKLGNFYSEMRKNMKENEELRKQKELEKKEKLERENIERIKKENEKLKERLRSQNQIQNPYQASSHSSYSFRYQNEDDAMEFE